MTETNSQHDDVLFDRLVDGELSPTERQQLLASLDERENGWRRCALAFLESQAWGGEFKRMMAQPSAAEQPTVTPAPSHESSTAGSTGRWLALAASLLLAFGVGWLTNSPSEEIQPTEQPLIANVEREESPLRDELPADFDADDAVTLLVRDVSGKNQRLQLPLMEVEALNNQFADALPDELRNRFRNRGFDVQRRRRFAPMFFEQNQELVPMMIPVDDTQIVPVSRPIY